MLTFLTGNIRAQQPVRLLPGERPPGRGWLTISEELSTRVYGGEVNAFRLTPAVEFGAGLNFSPKHGMGILTRLGPNELAGPLRAPLGFAALVWQRHRRREDDSWGAGLAWRRWRPESGRPGQRGWMAIYRKDFLGHPFTYTVTTDLTCFPRQCSVGLALGAGFHF